MYTIYLDTQLNKLLYFAQTVILGTQLILSLLCTNFDQTVIIFHRFFWGLLILLTYLCTYNKMGTLVNDLSTP